MLMALTLRYLRGADVTLRGWGAGAGEGLTFLLLGLEELLDGSMRSMPF